MAAGPDLNKASGAAALSPQARRVHQAVLRAFATGGHPPRRAELERLARQDRADPAAVVAELAGRDVLAFSAGGELRAAYPFSPSPTPIQVRWPGGPLTYAMCAIDALGISAMLGHPVTITAAEPGTGHPVTVHADGAGAQWLPAQAVVFTGTTTGACRHSADGTCCYINFFTSADAAQAWAARHPAVTGTVLTQAQALHQGVAEFGAFLRPAPRVQPPACSD